MDCLSTNHTGALPPQPPLSPAKQKSTVLTNPVSPHDKVLTHRRVT